METETLLMEKEINLDEFEFVPVENKKEKKKREKKIQMHVQFNDRSKYLLFRRYCKIRSINMSQLVRSWVNDCMDSALNEKK